MTSNPIETSPDHPAPLRDKKTMRLVSWNVNGIRAAIKKGFFDWLAQDSPDILGLQETKIGAEQLTLDMLAPEGYHTYWSHSGTRKGYSGVAIFSKVKPIKVTEGLDMPGWDDEGRTLIAEYPDFVFYNIYYPNGGRGDERLNYKLGFYEAFLEHVNKMRAEGKSIIVCGDFNTAHHPIDLARPKENVNVSGFMPIERDWLDRFTAHGYLDTYRHFYPEKDKMYSWWAMRTFARDRNSGWRIDYFFTSPDLKERLVDAGIETEVMGSDHCPVTLTLRV
jgi:exodeoxyribonuclease-3